MPRRKQARRTTVQDIRTILRLTHEQGLSAREVAARLTLSKTTVATYLNRVRISELPDSDYAKSRTAVSVIPGQLGHG
ncbi:response regulator of citrate/malate metabolism [Rhodobacteraceae bacterium MBR-64]|jgi:response regulator of citrate/malate metabolism